MMRRAWAAMAGKLEKGFDALERRYGERAMERVYDFLIYHEKALYALTVPVGLGLGIAIGMMIW